MPTVNELSEEKLEQYILKYKKRLQADPSDTDATRKLAVVEKELTKRRTEGKAQEPTGVTQTQAEEQKVAALAKDADSSEPPPGEIQKFHSDVEDISTYESATFVIRFVAVLIDTIIVSVANQILVAILGAALPPTALIASVLVLSMALQWAYFIILTYKTGQTLGKKVMKIKVVSIEGEAQPTLINVVIRETVGKFISGSVFLLGYIWVAFGKEAWHDSMAKTTVVKLD